MWRWASKWRQGQMHVLFGIMTTIKKIKEHKLSNEMNFQDLGNIRVQVSWEQPSNHNAAGRSRDFRRVNDWVPLTVGALFVVQWLYGKILYRCQKFCVSHGSACWGQKNYTEQGFVWVLGSIMSVLWQNGHHGLLLSGKLNSRFVFPPSVETIHFSNQVSVTTARGASPFHFDGWCLFVVSD